MTHAFMMVGDAETRLRDLGDRSVNAIICSPPYFGLRNYSEIEQIGHEDTPRAYVERLVAVFREARRVLRDDGSCWIVIGDCYMPENRGENAKSREVSGFHPLQANNPHSDLQTVKTKQVAMTQMGIKRKDLIGIPWMLAFALRDDGWYLREEIIWRKGSCMPESVTDRCTRQHETVFHLTKSQIYYHDWFAIAEPIELSSIDRLAQDVVNQEGSVRANGGAKTNGPLRAVGGEGGLRNARSVWTINPEPFDSQMCTTCGTYYRGADYKRLVKDDKGRRTCACGTNDRWLSHFAVYPSRLVSRIIRCSTPDGGCCPHCDTPLKRVIEKGEPDAAWQKASGADTAGGYAGTSRDGAAEGGAQDASATKARILAGMTTKRTVGWRRTCNCPAGEAVPAVVLDPFSGAGTTGMSAVRLGRHAILIDLKQEYHEMAGCRLQDPLAKCLDGDGTRLPFAVPAVSIG
jgi:DNA modification methylase